MTKAPKQKHASLKKVVAALIEALRKSSLLEQKSAEKLSDMLIMVDTYGCCTFMMGGNTYHANMTDQDCGRLHPPGSWSSSPC